MVMFAYKSLITISCLEQMVMSETSNSDKSHSSEQLRGLAIFYILYKYRRPLDDLFQIER